MNFEKKMIAFGYLAKEIPSEFQTESLATILEKIKFDSFSAKKKSLWTKSVQFTIPNGEEFRRTISVPSPLHQILLCKLISDNWDELESFFNQSDISMTTPIISEKDDLDIESKISISEKMDVRMKYLHNKNYILQTDISRFYPTIYTHVIPWAYHTKEYIKQNINKKNLLGNKLDSRIQYMQDGQTFGIPIGPSTSHVISEIIGTIIDNDFKNLMGKKVPGFRYTDDIEYYFDTEQEAKEALSKIHKVVNYYQLELNPIKTKIIKTPVEIEPEWKQYFSRFVFRNTEKKQRNDLNSYFSKSFAFKHKLQDKGILQYALKRVRSVVILKENWNVFESFLLHSAFSDHNTLPVVLEIFELYIIKEYPINKERVKEFLEKLIMLNINRDNHFEVCWALVYAKRMNISLNEEISKLLIDSDNAFICILTMILNDKKLLKGDLNFNKYKRFLNQEELYGSNWLFAYEAFNQGWLKPYSNPNYVSEDEFFKILYNNNVSFLQNEITLEELKNIMESSKLDIEETINKRASEEERITTPESVEERNEEATPPEPVEEGNEEATPPEPVEEGNEETTSPEPVEEGNEETTPPEPVEEGNEETIPPESVEERNEEATPPEPVEERNEETTSPEPVEEGNKEATPPEPVEERNEETIPPEPVEERNEEATPPEPVEEGNEETTSPEPVEEGNEGTIPLNSENETGEYPLSNDNDTLNDHSQDGSKEVNSNNNFNNIYLKLRNTLYNNSMWLIDGIKTNFNSNKTIDSNDNNKDNGY